MKMEVKKIAVVGAGIMGGGIAQVCAQAGLQTNVHDSDSTVLQKVSGNIKRTLGILADGGLINAEEIGNVLKRIQIVPTLVDAADDVDVVIEAVVEDISVKRSIFAKLDDLCRKETILASNTSSFSINEIASVTRRQDRVVGMHWWNPPYLMPLIEVVKAERTSRETVDATRDLAIKLGKEPAVCKDSPGFLGVRLQAALVIEATKMLDEGLASVEDIDAAVRMSLGFRLPVIGPFQTMDLGGLDTFLYAYDYLWKKLDDRFRPPDLLRNKVRDGDLGIKTRKGFYQYSEESASSLVKRRDQWLMSKAKEFQLEASRNSFRKTFGTAS